MGWNSAARAALCLLARTTLSSGNGPGENLCDPLAPDIRYDVPPSAAVTTPPTPDTSVVPACQSQQMGPGEWPLSD